MWSGTHQQTTAEERSWDTTLTRSASFSSSLKSSFTFNLHDVLLFSLRPWLEPKTGPGPQSVPGRAGPSPSMESAKEPNTRSESLPATLLEREHPDSQSPCLSGIQQVCQKRTPKYFKYLLNQR